MVVSVTPGAEGATARCFPPPVPVGRDPPPLPPPATPPVVPPMEPPVVLPPAPVTAPDPAFFPPVVLVVPLVTPHLAPGDAATAPPLPDWWGTVVRRAVPATIGFPATYG